MSAPYYADDQVALHLGDALDVALPLGLPDLNNLQALDMGRNYVVSKLCVEAPQIFQLRRVSQVEVVGNFNSASVDGTCFYLQDDALHQPLQSVMA